MPPDWLPELMLFDDYQGDWTGYIDEVYACFERDFVLDRPMYRGARLGVKRHPLIDGREATFWHIVSEGTVEAERIPDMRRCERVRWPRAIIEHCDEPCIKIWENTRRNERRILLWFEEQEYLVVLADRRGYTLFWTAYTVTQDHSKRKLQREYEAACMGRKS